jgi:hypothetical protein
MGINFSTENSEAVMATAGRFGHGHDIDDAVLAATNQQIDQEAQLVSQLTISVSCDDLVNLDTFSKSDAMGVFYRQQTG